MKKLAYYILFTLYACSNVSNDSKIPDLAIGRKGLNQQVSYKKLAEGLFFYQIQRGSPSPKDYFVLSSGAISEKTEKDLLKKLKEKGTISWIEEPAEKGPHGEFLGNIVRVGKFENIKDAQKKEQELKSEGIQMTVRHTAEDNKPTSGPFLLSILKIDLTSFKGNISSALGKNVIKEKAYVTDISKKNNALAAINGGFFAWNNTVGVDGEPAGISVINGELVSEATNGRSALVIDNNTPKKVSIAKNVTTRLRLFINDTSFLIHGINREAGKVLNCGNQIDSVRSRIPIHDFVCNNPNEIILFNKQFGKKSIQGEGIEFIINEEGKVISKNTYRGGEIPEKGYLIQATGSYIEELDSLIAKNQTIRVETKVFTDQKEIKLKNGIYLINGGPILLDNGKIDPHARFKEGFETQFQNFKVSDDFVDKKDKSSISDDAQNNRKGFYHGWVVRRHPRTAIGIKNNDVYIVVVYGRQPTITAGASITEMSTLFKQLGCTTAFNLDGGGSSMMVIKNRKTGKSSDISGEREVGDAILITE
ncbi:phosphodiester glycosidase family protein [Aquimarina sp. TRL1]|uniref:phosphodiester glycosidase family protein n=1 Tax=Aquimarina sp. (strain TRL1) TaxID=2736252 RepID=UPI00158E01AB|nr:phosphodiester glycosidase family protein [Aquimarina sp. TRL1]QKX05104.1 phosphodiester glycosidase family protein [Aquimarina sp. TRL1]